MNNEDKVTIQVSSLPDNPLSPEARAQKYELFKGRHQGRSFVTEERIREIVREETNSTRESQEDLIRWHMNALRKHIQGRAVTSIQFGTIPFALSSFSKHVLDMGANRLTGK